MCTYIYKRARRLLYTQFVFTMRLVEWVNCLLAAIPIVSI
jgi:hypothetical protein